MDYRCYHCQQTSAALKDIIEHCISLHQDKELKIRQLSVDNKTGRRQYVSKDFHVIPSKISARGQVIDVDETGTKIKLRCLDESEDEPEDAAKSNSSNQPDETEELLKIKLNCETFFNHELSFD